MVQMEETVSVLHPQRVDSFAEANVKGMDIVSLSHHMDIIESIEMPDEMKGRSFDVYVDKIHLTLFNYEGGLQKLPINIDCVGFLHNQITLRSEGPIHARLVGRMVSDDSYTPFLGQRYKACDGQMYTSRYNCISLDCS